MKQQHKGSITSKEMRVFPYLLILPNFLIFTIFIIVPAIFGIYYSLTDWSGNGDLNFIGLENYVELLGDTRFWISVRQTFIYALIALPLIVIIPLLLATQLVKSIRCRSFFRAVFYWPSMISYIVVGLLFQFIFGDSTGAHQLSSVRLSFFGGQLVHKRHHRYGGSHSGFCVVPLRILHGDVHLRSDQHRRHLL